MSFPAAEHGGGGGESSPVRVLAHTTRLVRCRRAWACGVGGAGGAGGAGVRREPMTRRGTVGSSRYRPRHCCHRATTPRRNEVNQLTAADSTRGARVCGPACSPRCAPGALFHQHRLSSPVRRSIFACILRGVTPQACGAGVRRGPMTRSGTVSSPRYRPRQTRRRGATTATRRRNTRDDHCRWQPRGRVIQRAVHGARVCGPACSPQRARRAAHPARSSATAACRRPSAARPALAASCGT